MVFVPKILIASQLASSPLWAFDFTRQRLTVILERTPANVLKRWMNILPELIIFDLDTAALALELVSTLRAESILPILLLTAIRDEAFILDAYKAGVDECILKPINPLLFHAKVKAWLRRSWNIPMDMLDPLRVGGVYLDPSNRALELSGRGPVHLTNLEFRLLYYFMARPGRTVTTEELCQRVWAPADEADVKTLKNLIYRLRQKIETDPANPRSILTVTGVGYQFMPE